MLRRIELINFMSHVHTVIEPGDGLTVLAGPNNCGKSAVVAALQALCSNARGDFMVRHGQNECRVLVATDDGHLVEWAREGDSVSYTVDGEQFHRVGGGVPEKLHEILRLPMVESPDGNDSFEIHFGEQKSPVFLLDRPGREAAMFFASASDAALLMQMQQHHRRNVAERKSQERRLAKAIDRLNGHLSCLEPVEALEQAVARAEQMYGELREAFHIQEELEAHIRSLQRQVGDVAHLQARCTSLETLGPPPLLAATEPLEKMTRELPRAAVAVSRAAERSEALAKLPTPPTFEDTRPLDRLCQTIQEQSVKVRAEQARVVGLRRLAALPPLVDPQPIADRVAQLSAAEATVRARSADVIKVSAALIDAEHAIRAWAETHQTCPLCGGLIDADDLVAGGGVHAHE